jgi:ATP synthase F1 gamma subunit
MVTFETFSEVVEGLLSDADLTEVDHPFTRPRNDLLGVVAVTSDAGLLGGLNMRIINAALEELEKEKGKLIILGEKGTMYAKEKGVGFVYMEGLKEDYLQSQAIGLRNYIVKEVAEGNLGKVKIIYPRAHSLVTQRIEIASLLPYGGDKKSTGSLNLDEFILESSLERMIEYLVYLLVGKRIYDIFNLSRLAEFAARFIHLEDCTTKIEDTDKKLRFKYFRLNHELTDRGMRELFAARLIFGRKQANQ